MASPPPRPAVMDPLHITEFASDRYFHKFNQQQQHQHQQQQQQHHQHQNGSAVASSSADAQASLLPLTPQLSHFQSPFILPLRDTRPLESPDESAVEPKPKRSRFTLGRLLHPKIQSSHTIHTPAPVVPAIPEPPTLAAPVDGGLAQFVPQLDGPVSSSLGPVSATQPTARVPRTFDKLFLNLPTELQIQIISSMPLADILQMRLASKSWHAMITANESPIVRFHLEHNVPAYAKRLYPADYSNLNFSHLCGLWHRLHVAAKLASFICEWVTKEIFLRTTEAHRQEFAPQRERMRRRLVPLLFTIFHFFETYRARHLQYIIDNNGKGLHQTPYTINPIEAEVMSMYDDRTLLQVHQVFPLVVASFCRRLRPPSYVGRVEKSLRGYLKDKPADEVHVAALCIGGLRQVEHFWGIKGYNMRRSAVDTWYNSIIKDTVEPVSKPRRGLMGLGRKKSSAAVTEDTSAAAAAAAVARMSLDDESPNDRKSMEVADVSDRANNLVFNTSLAGGMPMGPMSREQLRLLLPDLPVLQQMWLVSAEALILERKIVERASDIRRNAQVMLDLIGEDGIAEEDEWWYGDGSHDLRVALDAIEEDASEDAHHIIHIA